MTQYHSQYTIKCALPQLQNIQIIESQIHEWSAKHEQQSNIELHYHPRYKTTSDKPTKFLLVTQSQTPISPLIPHRNNTGAVVTSLQTFSEVGSTGSEICVFDTSAIRGLTNEWILLASEDCVPALISEAESSNMLSLDGREDSLL